MPTTPRKRNRAAQDTTLINLRAIKRRINGLEKRVTALEEMNDYIPVRMLESLSRKAAKRR